MQNENRERLKRIEGRFEIKPVLITSGEIAPSGNSYHIIIRKKEAGRLEEGKMYYIMLFEL